MWSRTSPGHAAIKAEQPRGDEHAQKSGETHHESGGELVQRATIERVEELRAALKSDGVDEQREEDALDSSIDRNAELAPIDAILMGRPRCPIASPNEDRKGLAQRRKENVNGR